MRSTKGMIIASAAAGLILAGAVATRADQQEKKAGEKVNCSGINACKGKGSCAGPSSSCAGQNSCKGKGVVETTPEDCAKQGGKVVDKKM
jgi:uncharacterized membrane protein